MEILEIKISIRKKSGFTVRAKNTMKKEMAQTSYSRPQEKKIRLTIGNIYIELKDHDKKNSNRKVLSILGRELKFVETNEPVLTFQEIANELGYADRRNVQNLHRKFKNSGEDFEKFLIRKNYKSIEKFSRTEKQLKKSFLRAEKQLEDIIKTLQENFLND